MWKTLNYNGEVWPNYEVHPSGMIRSIDRSVTDTRGFTRYLKGKLLTPRQTKEGYMMVDLSNFERRVTAKVHRAVMCTFMGHKKHKHVHHKDEDKANNVLDNLKWVTPQQNARKSAHKQRGAKNSQAVLTTKQVKRIKRVLKEYQHGDIAKLAKAYNVSRVTISAIKSGKSWK